MLKETAELVGDGIPNMHQIKGSAKLQNLDQTSVSKSARTTTGASIRSLIAKTHEVTTFAFEKLLF